MNFLGLLFRIINIGNVMKKVIHNESVKAGIVFDMDYTLVYPTVEFDVVFEKFFDVPLSTVSERWLGSIYDNPTAKGHEIIKYTFPDMSTEEAKEKAISFGLEWAKVHNIYPGCVDFLSTLKSNPLYKLGLLTNGPSDFQRAIIEFLDISKYFDVIVASGDEDVGVRKPNKDVFGIMAQKMNLSAESLFMLGDVIDKDIIPAVELGWGGIWIAPTVEIVEISPRISLQDLLSNSHSIQDNPLSIGWSDIEVESTSTLMALDQHQSNSYEF